MEIGIKYRGNLFAQKCEMLHKKYANGTFCENKQRFGESDRAKHRSLQIQNSWNEFFYVQQTGKNKTCNFVEFLIHLNSLKMSEIKEATNNSTIQRNSERYYDSWPEKDKEIENEEVKCAEKMINDFKMYVSHIRCWLEQERRAIA